MTNARIFSLLTFCISAIGCDANDQVEGFRSVEQVHSLVHVTQSADGDVVLIDAAGSEITSDIIAVDTPYSVTMDDGWWVEIGGIPVVGEMWSGGLMRVGPDANTLRCACVDANGVPWTQDCNLDYQTCAVCCWLENGLPNGGGGTVPKDKVFEIKATPRGGDL